MTEKEQLANIHLALQLGQPIEPYGAKQEGNMIICKGVESGRSRVAAVFAEGGVLPIGGSVPTFEVGGPMPGPTDMAPPAPMPGAVPPPMPPEGSPVPPPTADETSVSVPLSVELQKKLGEYTHTGSDKLAHEIIKDIISKVFGYTKTKDTK